jgi:hypothetical protein
MVYTKQNSNESLDSKKHGYFGGTRWFYTNYTITGTYVKIPFVWQGPYTSGDSATRSKRIIITPAGTNAGDTTFSFNAVDAPDPPSAVTSTAAGNLNGSYIWKVTFVTAEGETIASAVSTTVAIANKKATVTIPINTDPSRIVTSRKLYRTVAGPGLAYLLVDTIANNTATTYTDNIADGSLGAVAPTTNTTGQTAGVQTAGSILTIDGVSFPSIYVKGTIADTVKIYAWG